MTTDLALYEGKQPLVMKGGVTHWVSIAMAEKIQEQLLSQTAHTFIRLRELGITINSAEIEGVYTISQYDAIAKTKEGMWQCEYMKWHNKGKRECECKAEFYRERDRKRRELRTQDIYRELNPEERARSIKKFESIGDVLRRQGVIGSVSANSVRGENGRQCLKCDTKLVGSIKYYCSGTCIAAAKEDGTYDHEEELKLIGRNST